MDCQPHVLCFEGLLYFIGMYTWAFERLEHCRLLLTSCKPRFEDDSVFVNPLGDNNGQIRACANLHSSSNHHWCWWSISLPRFFERLRMISIATRRDSDEEMDLLQGRWISDGAGGPPSIWSFEFCWTTYESLDNCHCFFDTKSEFWGNVVDRLYLRRF